MGSKIKGNVLSFIKIEKIANAEFRKKYSFFSSKRFASENLIK